MDTLKDFLKKSNDKSNNSTGFVGKLKISVSSDIGKIRTGNEDNFYCEKIGVGKPGNSTFALELPLDDRKIFAVCDGMGGELYGEDSSQIAVDCVQEYLDKFKSATSGELDEVVNSCINEANREICQMISEKHCKNSGSTIALLFIDNYYVRFYTIGDSRVYRLCEDELIQLSEDQTLAVKKLKANIYTQEEAEHSPDSHKLTSYIGADVRGVGLKPMVYNRIKTSRGVYMLCTDGLTDMCSKEEMRNILLNNYENTAEDLTKKALENGGIDNITCIVIKIE